MSEHDAVGDALERLEWRDKRSGSISKAAQLTRRTALTGGAAGLAAVLLEACGNAGSGVTGTVQAASASSPPVQSIFGVKGGYRFAFVNHATAASFFTPTVNGIEDACQLLNCSYQWTGSNSTNVGQMATAINTAASAGVDGIATTLISTALAEPVDAAMRAGIPVISYNADVPNTGRLAYIGQDLALSGQAMGREISQLLPRGGTVMIFIATPGSANLQPRLDGIREVLGTTNIRLHTQASGATEPQQLKTIQALVGQHLTTYDGYFAVDAGSTAAVAEALQKYNLKGKVTGGGFDLTGNTEQLLYDGTIQFAIDQQPYLQGFLATIELFLYRATQRLTGAADVDTGLRFLYPHTVKPYATTKSRYEGTSTAVGVQNAG
jgi:simple sugar transport system substrate-binding protein